AFCYKAFVYEPATNQVYGAGANCGVYPQPSTTNIARTVGWHTLLITWDPQHVALSIDDQPIFQRTGAFNFDTVHLDLAGPSFRPNATYYFDDLDVALVPLSPAAPTNLVSTSPAVGQVDLTWTDTSTDEARFELAQDDSL